MFKLLVLIVLFIVLFPVLKVWLLMRRARRHMEQAVERAAAGRDPSNAAGQRRSAEAAGEYADFEDVSGAVREPQPAGPACAPEQQVVDAEFEDI